jgi:hypothetical protein
LCRICKYSIVDEIAEKGDCRPGERSKISGIRELVLGLGKCAGEQQCYEWL